MDKDKEIKRLVRELNSLQSKYNFIVNARAENEAEHPAMCCGRCEQMIDSALAWSKHWKGLARFLRRGKAIDYDKALMDECKKLEKENKELKYKLNRAEEYIASFSDMFRIALHDVDSYFNLK